MSDWLMSALKNVNYLKKVTLLGSLQHFILLVNFFTSVRCILLNTKVPNSF